MPIDHENQEEQTEHLGDVKPRRQFSFDPTADQLIGYEIDGRYRIIKLLGSGGWGNVYKGRHLTLGVDIAIKVMHKHLAKDEIGLKRLSQEAVLLNRLNSPYIVGLMDHGITPAPYIVMEYFDGTTLSTWLEDNGPLAYEHAIELFMQICDGLINAHELGLVHRDLKPSNIMLKLDGEKLSSKILDFGIAKLTSLDSGQPRLTSTGEILGSPPYMSPEQWSGILDHRSDLYSFGCIMYEALSGKPAFTAQGGMVGYLNKHVSSAAPAISEVAPEAKFPKSLEDLIRKCMQKNPENRYGSSIALRADLALVRAGKEIKIRLKDENLPSQESETAANASLWKRPLSLSTGIKAGTAVVSLAALLVMFSEASRLYQKKEPVDSRWHVLDLEGQQQFDSGNIQDARQSFRKELELADSANEQKLVEASLNELLDIDRCLGDKDDESSTLKRLGSLKQTESLPYYSAEIDRLIGEAERNKKTNGNTAYFQFHVRQLCTAANEFALKVLDSGNMEGIEELISKSKRLATIALESQDPVLVQCIYVQSDLFGTNAEYQRAIDGYTKALALMRSSDKQDDKLVIHILSHLSWAEAQLAKSPESIREVIETNERASKLARQKLDPNSQELAQNEWLLSLIFSQFGEENKAKNALRRALAICENSKQPDEACRADCYQRLGGLNQDRELIRKSLAIRESQSAKNYGHLLRSLLELARSLVSTNPAQAESLLQRVIVLNQRLDKTNADVVNNLVFQLQGHIQRIEHKFDKAEKSLNEALHLRQVLWGYYSPQVVETHTEMATLFSDKGQTAAAEDAFKKGIAILEINKKKKGRMVVRFADTVPAYRNLIDKYTAWLQKQNRQEEARSVSLSW